jgi:putative thioredoxin
VSITKRLVSGTAAAAVTLVVLAPMANSQEDDAVKHVETVAEHEGYIKETSQKKLVVTKFGATWCPPCQQMKPVIEKMAKDSGGKWMLADVDADKTRDLVSTYGVKYLPTVMTHYKGDEISAGKDNAPNRLVGFPGEAKLKEWIDSNLAKTGG